MVQIILADRAALIIGTLAGGAIAARYGLDATYRLSLLGFLGALGVAFTLREPARGLIETRTGYWRHIAAAARFLHRRPDLRPVLLLGIIVSAVQIYADEFWQVYLLRIHGLLFGWAAERWPVFLGYIVLGFFVLVFGVCFLKRLWKCDLEQ